MALRFICLRFAVMVMLTTLTCTRRPDTPSQAIAPVVPDVTLCEVLIDAPDFEGQFIRLHAVLVNESMHGGVLAGGNCMKRERITWPKLSDQQMAQVVKTGRAAEYEIVALGTFSHIGPSYASDLYADQASFQFDVSSLESVNPLDITYVPPNKSLIRRHEKRLSRHHWSGETAR